VFSARGVQQQRLAGGIPALAISLDQQLADCLGSGGAARLAGESGRNAGALQRGDQGLGLGRFPGPLPAFQRDEFSARGQWRLPQIR